MTSPETTGSRSAAASYTPPAAGSRFVWHDLMTTDPAASTAFFRALLGWETSTVPIEGMGEYTMAGPAGAPQLGGIVPLDAAHGLPSHWMAYVSVPDVDAACAQVAALGGVTCVAPTDIPGVGRFAVVEDPSGAYFSPFRSSTTPDDAPDAPPALGGVAWMELMTSDPEGMLGFYAALCGWSTGSMNMGEQGTYWLFRRGEAFVAGMMELPPERMGRPYWMPYFAVASADDAAARITALGGTLVAPVMPVQDWGRMAIGADPAGAVFGVLENLQPM